ncbi:LysR family transcriptional regulator [Amycolatopsis aidingensis]|uniref:LysR family transcriptional regulator n=1 Tax=Amycolatopsis aidingensis TaxID=2842453 RepID=UPI001C0B9208|nr:LysR family transcriptional regulator [Amycolatopsis aidingensis]
MLDVRRLRLLRELSAHGTIAATARGCALTPSAVSQQLSLLEREVGVPLLFRDGRRLVLTEAARVLVGHTERILADLEQASAEVAELTSAVRGVLHLAAFPTAARTLVPGAITRCREAHPDLRVLLAERSIPEAITELKAGGIDLALIHEYNLLPRVRDAGVDTEPLVREPLLAALPAGLPAGTGPFALEALADQPWIAPHGDEALRAMLERACGMAGFTPRVDYVSSDYTAIFALVRAGLGVSLVPRMALETAAGDIRLAELALPELHRTVSAALRTGSRTSPPIAALLDALRRTAAEYA